MPYRLGDAQRQAHGGVHGHGERHPVGPINVGHLERVDGDVGAPDVVAGGQEGGGGSGQLQRLVSQLVCGDQQDPHDLEPTGEGKPPPLVQRSRTSRQASARRRASSTNSGVGPRAKMNPR